MNKFVGECICLYQEMQWKVAKICPVTCHLTIALCRSADNENVNERRDSVSYGNYSHQCHGLDVAVGIKTESSY